MKLTDLDKVLQAKMKKALDGLPTILVNEAVNWTKDNFNRQGFPGKTFEQWPKRKPGSNRNTGRAILIDTSRLKRGVRMFNTGPLRASFGVDVPYARAHNYGFKGTVNVSQHNRRKFGFKRSAVGIGIVKSHQRNMNLPRRRFIGYSPVLQSILRRKALIHLSRHLKS